MKEDTLLIHGGFEEDVYTGSVNVPIYQTSTYKQDGLGKLRHGYEYSRTGNPTRHALEQLIADLEHAKYGLAFASGLAAIDNVLSLLHPGDKIIVSSNVYGGTFRLLDQVLKNYGLTYILTDTTDLNKVENVLKDESVKVLYLETPANPLMSITDIQKASELAHKYGKLVFVDNTFMSPYLQKPLELGADIVIHSATKYLGGHSDLIAGVIALNDDDLAKRLYFLQNSKGAILSPFDSFLLIRGIKTLGVRMDRHCDNALKIAQFMHDDHRFTKVYFPGLKDDLGYDIQKRQAKKPGAVISFELDKSYDYHLFVEKLKVITLGESLGGVESLICHPSTMTHAAFPQKLREEIGITESLLRLSVGIEDVDDLIEDIEYALTISKKA